MSSTDTEYGVFLVNQQTGSSQILAKGRNPDHAYRLAKERFWPRYSKLREDHALQCREIIDEECARCGLPLAVPPVTTGARGQCPQCQKISVAPASTRLAWTPVADLRDPEYLRRSANAVEALAGYERGRYAAKLEQLAEHMRELADEMEEASAEAVA